MPHLHYGDGIRLGFLSCTEIKSKDLSLSSCNVKCSPWYNVEI